MTRLAIIAAVLIGTLSAASAGPNISGLDAAVRAACADIDGIAVGTSGDRATWRIDFKPAASPGCQAAAQAALAGFDITSVDSNLIVTRMQAMVALSSAGLLAEVQNWVASQDATTQLIWANTPSFTRGSPLIARAAAALGLSAAQIDQLFLQAAQINP